MNQQIVSFKTLYLHLKEEGIYLVEDTHTSYWYEFHGGLKKKNTFIEYAKNLIDSLYESHMPNLKNLSINEITKHINSISFYDSIIVFEKKIRPKPFHLDIGEKTISPYKPTELKKQSILMKIKSLFRKQIHPFKLNQSK